MNHYQTEVHRIKRICFGNQAQLDTIIEVKNYLVTHCDLPLNQNQLAQLFCMSKFHLIKLFKRYYGQTPHQYLIDQRIARAKTHLQQGKSVTETCMAVGFESVGTFSSLFKRKTGKTPSEFKKAQF